MTISGTAQTALHQSLEAFDKAAQGVQQASLPAAAQVELSEAAVRLMQAQRQVEASLMLAETADEIAQSALDVIA